MGNTRMVNFLDGLIGSAALELVVGLGVLSSGFTIAGIIILGFAIGKGTHPRTSRQHSSAILKRFSSKRVDWCWEHGRVSFSVSSMGPGTGISILR